VAAITSTDLHEAFPDEFRYLEQQRIEEQRRLEQHRREERILQRIEEADQAYESRQWERASRLFGDVLGEIPNSHPLRRFVKYARADCLTHLGNRAEAEGLVDKERVDTWRAGVARASAYVYLGQLDQADTDLLAALLDIPDGADQKEIILEALAYVRLLLTLDGLRVENLRQAITSFPRK
jgi:tetratricopeptide (TPR) repeat protein